VAYLGQNVAWTATNALRLDLTLHCLRLDMPFHKAHAPGELIERIDGDVSELATFFSQLVIRLLGNGLLVLGVLLLLFREDWRVGLVAAMYILLAVALLRRVQTLASQAWSDSRQAQAELMGFLGERLAGTEDIRANGAEPYVMRQLHQLMRVLLQRGRRAPLMGSLTFILGYSAFVLVVIATLGIGAVLFLRGLITIGTVYLLLSYVNKLYEPLQEVQRQIAALQRSAASVGRVSELLQARPRVVESMRAVLPPGPLHVAFEGVSFHYDDGGAGGDAPGTGAASNGRDASLATDSVLDDVSFSLAPGQVLGLLGRTGSGKTTLTRLLFRLYDPTSGAITLGGADIRGVGLSDLRRRVGMVTQDVQLFKASVRDNLTFFNQRVPDEQILAVLKEVGLWAWYESLAEGLDTVLEAGGKDLSAGEAQLLAFARVFLKEPGLVILDEASSRLDPATERLLERAVDRLLHGRTAIIVAHRLTTVQRADEILVLEHGRVHEHGDRQVLAADPASRFHSLLQTRLGEAAV
jgi:ABC-type multidrug transport system fused ATPase/permease subunit